MAENQTALITGASRGLGRTLAQFLAAQGADLVLTARGAAALEAAAQELAPYGRRVIALPGDVADAGHRRRLAQAAEELGGLDLLVNNASILGPSPLPALADYSLEALEQVLAVNVLAPLGLVQATLPLLRRRRGLVINLSSDAAVGGYAGWGGYGGSKAALDLLSLMLANELADAGHRRRLAQAAAELGGLDLLVNNASTLGPSPLPALADYPLEALEQVLEVNVLAPLGLVQAALPLLRRRRGLVINLSSDAAVGGYAGWGGYGGSKAALDLLSLTLANELAGDGVAVVSVDPGDMRTQMHQDAFPGEDISDRPLPAATLPFWVWLLGQDQAAINGKRLAAQAEVWAV